MLPGDAPTSPLPLTARIVIALHQLRAAREHADADVEFAWQNKLDELLDMFIALRKTIR